MIRTRQQGTEQHYTENPEQKIAAIRKIVDDKQFAIIDGATLDLYSASAIIRVYDNLSPANQEKYLKFHVYSMAKIAFKLLQ